MTSTEIEFELGQSALQARRNAKWNQYDADVIPAFVADMGTYDLWLASFRDSENNLLALMSHVPKKPK